MVWSNYSTFHLWLIISRSNEDKSPHKKLFTLKSFFRTFSSSVLRMYVTSLQCIYHIDIPCVHFPFHALSFLYLYSFSCFLSLPQFIFLYHPDGDVSYKQYSIIFHQGSCAPCPHRSSHLYSAFHSMHQLDNKQTINTAVHYFLMKMLQFPCK